MSLSEFGQLIPWIFLLVIVYILSRMAIQWRMKRAFLYLLRDLEKKEAFNPSSAVNLPYAKKSLMQIGFRDFKPKVLEDLVANGIVGRTSEGKYYLIKRMNNIQ
ncbi:MAG: hypothetical protein C4582_08760 [Desulfobacteraceae bacterium]|nr:MAG: hypothetical protein C4582_08760 [Desulfobacteraceae bacterium]